MKHARADYDRIQDPAGLIPEDEPVMLFRGQDKHFHAVCLFYACLVEQDDPASPIPHLTRSHAALGRLWPFKKAPDLPSPEAAPTREAQGGDGVATDDARVRGAVFEAMKKSHEAQGIPYDCHVMRGNAAIIAAAVYAGVTELKAIEQEATATPQPRKVIHMPKHRTDVTARDFYITPACDCGWKGRKYFVSGFPSAEHAWQTVDMDYADHLKDMRS